MRPSAVIQNQKSQSKMDKNLAPLINPYPGDFVYSSGGYLCFSPIYSFDLSISWKPEELEQNGQKF